MMNFIRYIKLYDERFYRYYFCFKYYILKDSSSFQSIGITINKYDISYMLYYISNGRPNLLIP